MDDKIFDRGKDDGGVNKADEAMETGVDSPVYQNQQIKDFQSQYKMQLERKNFQNDAQMNDEYSFDFNEEEFNKVHTGNSLLQKKGTNASNQSKDGK